MRAIYDGEITDEARALFDELLAAGVADLTMATSRLAECPNDRYGEGEGCGAADKLPEHVTCGPGTNPNGGICWCWSGCDDPQCDHPSCAGRGWRTFDFDDDREVLLWASEWLPWLDSNPRHPILLAERREDSKPLPDPAKMLTALERGVVLPVRFGLDYLDMEIALVESGVALEERTTCTVGAKDFAFRIARGSTSVEEAKGGLVQTQIRLGVALDLGEAPSGYQGSLFG